jgi:hypothetical protein
MEISSWETRRFPLAYFTVHTNYLKILFKCSSDLISTEQSDVSISDMMLLSGKLGEKHS